MFACLSDRRFVLLVFVCSLARSAVTALVEGTPSCVFEKAETFRLTHLESVLAIYFFWSSGVLGGVLCSVPLSSPPGSPYTFYTTV